MNPIPPNYVLNSQGEWCHPSRIPAGQWHRLQTGELVCRPQGPTKREIALQSHGTPPPSHFDPPGGVKTPKRIRQSSKPLLNALEREFQCFVQAHTDLSLVPQSIRFMLANGIWYKPDFVCFCPLVCYEIKGPHAFRGGFENLKVAASRYPQFTWKLMWKQGAQWKEQIVLP